MFKKWKTSKKEEDYIAYRIARRDVKRTKATSKKDTWVKYGEDLSKLCKEKPRDFYKSVKSMRMRNEEFNPTTIINDEKGNPILNNEKRKERWAEYFNNLLNPVGTNKEENAHKFTPKYKETEETIILESKVLETIRTCPKNKSPGVDEIPIEAVQACGTTGVKWLKRIFNIAWKERKVPEDWQKAIIVPIWKKKGNKRDCNTYRGISLLSHIGKVYAKILERRARPILETQLDEAQFGFRKGRGCTDALFALRQISEKTIEGDGETKILFID